MSKKMNESLRILIAEKFRNTALGFLRIKKNLGISHLADTQTETYLKKNNLINTS
jgi:hypothetical protein